MEALKNSKQVRIILGFYSRASVCEAWHTYYFISSGHGVAGRPHSAMLNSTLHCGGPSVANSSPVCRSGRSSLAVCRCDAARQPISGHFTLTSQTDSQSAAVSPRGRRRTADRSRPSLPLVVARCTQRLWAGQNGADRASYEY